MVRMGSGHRKHLIYQEVSLVSPSKTGFHTFRNANQFEIWINFWNSPISVCIENCNVLICLESMQYDSISNNEI